MISVDSESVLHSVTVNKSKICNPSTENLIIFALNCTNFYRYPKMQILYWRLLVVRAFCQVLDKISTVGN